MPGNVLEISDNVQSQSLDDSHDSVLRYPLFSSAPASGDSDAYHVHNLELHTAHCFTDRIISQVNALTLDIPVGMLAFESEGSRAAIDHECIDNPVTLGSLYMRCHLEHVRVNKLVVPFQ